MRNIATYGDIVGENVGLNVGESVGLIVGEKVLCNEDRMIEYIRVMLQHVGK